MWVGLCWTSVGVMAKRAVEWSSGRKLPVFGGHIPDYLEVIDILPKEYFSIPK